MCQHCTGLLTSGSSPGPASGEQSIVERDKFPPTHTYSTQTQLIPECALQMQLAHPGSDFALNRVEQATTCHLARAYWSLAWHRQPWNATSHKVSGLLRSYAAACLSSPKLVLCKLPVAQPGSIPGEQHRACCNCPLGCLSQLRAEMQLLGSLSRSALAQAQLKAHLQRINPAQAAHQQRPLPIQLFPCTPLPPPSTH